MSDLRCVINIVNQLAYGNVLMIAIMKVVANDQAVTKCLMKNKMEMYGFIDFF